VIFPLRVFPRQIDKPVTLRGKIDYAVCEKLCVPVEANVELTLAGAGGADNAALAAAEARVPQPVSAAEAGLTARRANDDKRKPLVFVDLAAPPGRQHFSFELDGLPPGVDPKGPFELTFTIVKGGSATEVKTHLD
jgi:DsbC/DsbD-like thiol-disulfide interchange protein